MLYEGAALKNKTEHLSFDVDTFFRERRSIVFYSCCGSVLSCGLFLFTKEQFHGKMVSHYSRLVADFLE